MLLAEDQSSIRAVLREFLESKGYTILEARNGRQALELAEHHPSSIEVLVTDVILPKSVDLNWPSARPNFTRTSA